MQCGVKIKQKRSGDKKLKLISAEEYVVTVPEHLLLVGLVRKKDHLRFVRSRLMTAS